MPSKPFRLCPRCNQRVQGPCEQCNKQREVQYDKWRGTAASRGYDARWTEYSKARLAQYPLCARCEREGRLEAAVLTGHKVPGWKNMDLFWEPDNHESLCAACNRKQDIEDRARDGAEL